jgi:hypothetical protein
MKKIAMVPASQKLPWTGLLDGSCRETRKIAGQRQQDAGERQWIGALA